MVYIQLEKTDFDVLSFLIKNIKEEYSIKELSTNLKRPYVKIHHSIKRLAHQKIIKENVKGKSHYCSLNDKSNQDVICFINAQQAKTLLKKNKKFELIMTDILTSIKFPNYSLLIFGSYAKGNANKHSDLDIAILTSHEDKEEAEQVMNSVKRYSSLKIHSLEFTYQNFIAMLKTKENNVGKEIVKTHIIIKGCEQFYECMRLAE